MIVRNALERISYIKNPGRIPRGRGGIRGVQVEYDRQRQNVNPKTFSYSDDILDELEATLSRERLGTYLRETDGDREKAVRLHVWNTEVSAAFYGPLQTMEVAFRNAAHRALAGQYGSTWHDNGNVGLDKGARVRIAMTRQKLVRDSHRDAPHRVVSSLSFGFWVSPLGSGGRLGNGNKANCEMTIWRPALRDAFPCCDKLRRKDAHRPLEALRKLRNRIAHHEPIFSGALKDDHERILEVAGWISPNIRAWIRRHSRVPEILGRSWDDGAAKF